MGFAPQTQEVVLKPETPAGKFDAEMSLASREQEQGVGNLAALITAGRGFQSLALDSTLSALAGGGAAGLLGGGQNGNGSDVSSLPLNGAGAEGPTESVSISGAQGRTQDCGGGSEDDLQERIQEFRDCAQREGGGLQGGGPGGGPGLMTFGGPGGPGGGGGRRRAQNNINFGMNWTRNSTTLVNPFPSLNGGNSLQGLNASSGWTYGRGRATNTFRVNYNHNHVATTNLYSNIQNVAGDAGIGC